jgi:4-carboxymuconolactone decarboxylase
MAELPFDPATLSPEDKALYDAMVARRKSQGAPFYGPYAALMNHPQLCRRIEEAGYYLKFEGHLSREIYEFAVIATARETAAPFMWLDHVDHARKAGVPEDVLETLRVSGVHGASFPEPYQLAAQVLQSAFRWKNIPAPVQTEAIARFSLHGYIELVVLAGFYQLFSVINQGFDVNPPSDKPRPF